jgi:hypothetical protein
VNDEEHHAGRYASQRVPTLFTFDKRIALSNNAWIFKHQDRGLEADTVLQSIPTILLFVPFKTHGRTLNWSLIIVHSICQYMCTYVIALSVFADLMSMYSADSSALLLPFQFLRAALDPLPGRKTESDSTATRFPMPLLVQISPGLLLPG